MSCARRNNPDRLAIVTDRSGKSAEQMRKEQRLSRALRENLKRRKAQLKGRAASHPHASASHDSAPHDSAGIADDKQKG
jgi:hypothetical protein